jgi:uncharacterized protein
MPWDGGKGFVNHPIDGDRAASATIAYLTAQAEHFSHLFVSWQPRDRGRLVPEQYFPAYDHLFAALGDRYPIRALHHTALNMGALEAYDRAELLAFTNALVERYRFAWVNEDLGLWSLHGKSLPYPLPPYLTDAGLAAAIRNVRDVQSRLVAPLLVEFPGFSDGLAFFIGRLHAYDFFRKLAEETDVAITLDTGHLLSYQWLLGRRGADLYDDLERLPLEHCFEIHLSGCEIDGERFHDRHHGILLDEQIELLERLVPLCPNVRAITYEDPVFDATGSADPSTQRGFERLRSSVQRLSCRTAP